MSAARQVGAGEANRVLCRPKPLVTDRSLVGLVDDWETFLQDGVDEMEAREFERRLSEGRPRGSRRFVRGLERRFGRSLAARKGGRPKGSRKGD